MAGQHRVPELPDLPVVDALPALRVALGAGRRVVLVAPPGAGKTTVVPLALLDEPWLEGRRIVMLEPRRLATRAAARRMAATTSTTVGDLVGYRTRDERHIGPSTRIEVLTEGVLTRRLQHDAELAGVGLVVFDEVHERNLPTDLGLALTLDVASTIRPDLRIIAMSATPDVDRLRDHLDAEVVVSDGRAFDVEIHWASKPPPSARRASRTPRALDQAVVSTVLRALRDQTGDVLVFLPGIGEIRRVEAQLAPAVDDRVDVVPLAGALGADAQDLALAPAAPGRRKVVLSTDIAESSLTVPGVRVVVDAGLAREPRFDPRSGMSRLTTVATSRASADQRAGRAGRTEDGVAYRLWSRLEHGTRPAHRAPEIAHADLAQLALEMAAWSPTGSVRWLDAPPAAALAQARELLALLGAIDDTGRPTSLGETMLHLPFHPRLARMIALDRSTLACAIAALLDDRDVVRGDGDDIPADLALRVDALAGRPTDARVDHGALRRVRERSIDAARRAEIRVDLDDVDAGRTGAVLLLAYPDRLAGSRRRGQFQLRSGRSAWVPDGDPLAGEAFVVAADLDGRKDRARIRLGAAVEVVDVVDAFGDDVGVHRELVWDQDCDDLVEIVERNLGAIRLGQQRRRPEPGPDTMTALMDRVRATSLEVLPWSAPAMHLRDRVGYLRRSFGTPWPDWSTVTLVATLDEWLVPYLPGAASRADLDRVDLAMVLRSQLPWPDGAQLDDLAPASWTPPSGRPARIEYHGDVPTCSVRVQDLFGLTEHPLVAGRPMRFELLSPADRVIQITADLPGFWRGSWEDVRKDMAGRYPKHSWPADPTTAPPRRTKGD